MEGPLIGDQYEIVTGAALDNSWAEWFEEFEVTAEGETTRLTGTIADQAALHGVLARLRDLAIPIVTVHRLASEIAPLEDLD
jgi:hypothetical protein